MSAPTQSPPAVLLGIGQIAIRAKDLPRAVRFYRDVLGLQYLFEAPSLAFFQVGGIHRMLGPAAETPELDPGGSRLYFDVAGIKAASRTLLERGVHFRDEPHIVHRAGE